MTVEAAVADRARLAQVAGRYQERRPVAWLIGHVSRVWINEITQRTALQIVPDGCMDIIWTGETLQVAGPDTRVVVETLSPAALVGIRFEPGAAPRWLNAPAAPFLNSRPPLDLFWGRAATDRLTDRLASLSGPLAIAQALEGALTERLPNVGAPEPFIRTIVREVTRDRHDRTPLIGRLLDSLGCTERTLRRRCDEAFGYGPIALQRILRFARFQRLSRSHKAPLSMLALAAGYADQAHLTRESRRLSGLTPRRLLHELDSAVADSFNT